MTIQRGVFFACCLLAGIAQAHTATRVVTESTGPAKAAAVEQAAREIQALAARDAKAGKAPSAVGVVRGTTPAGLTFQSGGITVGDRIGMYAERGEYSLWVATVAKPSGAYLTDAQLRIVDQASQAVGVERTMDGPWFMLVPPPGRYEVAATLRADGATKPQSLTATVNAPRSGQRQSARKDSGCTGAS